MPRRKRQDDPLPWEEGERSNLSNALTGCGCGCGCLGVLVIGLAAMLLFYASAGLFEDAYTAQMGGVGVILSGIAMIIVGFVVAIGSLFIE